METIKKILEFIEGITWDEIDHLAEILIGRRYNAMILLQQQRQQQQPSPVVSAPSPYPMPTENGKKKQLWKKQPMNAGVSAALKQQKQTAGTPTAQEPPHHHIAPPPIYLLPPSMFTMSNNDMLLRKREFQSLDDYRKIATLLNWMNENDAAIVYSYRVILKDFIRTVMNTEPAYKNLSRVAKTLLIQSIGETCCGVRMADICLSLTRTIQQVGLNELSHGEIETILKNTLCVHPTTKVSNMIFLAYSLISDGLPYQIKLSIVEHAAMKKKSTAVDTNRYKFDESLKDLNALFE